MRLHRFAVMFAVSARGFLALSLCSSVSNAEEKPSEPSKEYERALQPGGSGDLRRFEKMLTWDVLNPKLFKVPHGTVRAYYDLAGLPKDSESKFGLAHEKLHHSPESIKRDLLRRNLFVQYEIWRLHLLREEISWTALISGPPGSRAPLEPEPGSSESWLWVLDPERGNVPRWDRSIEGRETLWFRNQPVLGESGVRRLVRWRLSRIGGRYVTPRLNLADLEEVAPWFHQHIPPYVLDRAGNRKHSDLNLCRPCRECDVLILDAPDSEYRIRFMVPAPDAKADGEASAEAGLDP